MNIAELKMEMVEIITQTDHTEGCLKKKVRVFASF